MMFELSEEHRMLKDLVAKFVDQELIPLERPMLAREAAGGKVGLTDAEEEKILARCKALGLWSWMCRRRWAVRTCRRWR